MDQLQVALTIVIADTFMLAFPLLIPDILLESPIFDMLVSFIPDMPDMSPPFVTSPVNVTVCPTCPASETFLLHTSQVFPSLPTSLNVSGLSPF